MGTVSLSKKSISFVSKTCLLNKEYILLFERELQTFSKYFEAFWCFTKFYHKWNDARLLLIKMVYRSFLTSCRMTKDVASLSDSNSPHTPSHLFFFERVFSHCFNLKLERLSCKIALKFPLLGNCYSDLFTEVKIWY